MPLLCNPVLCASGFSICTVRNMTIPTVQSHEVKSKNPGYGVCTLQSEKTLGPKLLALSSGVLYTEYEYTPIGSDLSLPTGRC